MKTASISLTLLTGLLTHLAACERVSDQVTEDHGVSAAPTVAPRVEPAETPSAKPPSTRSAPRNAAISIAESRCQREESCKHVGASKKYSSAQDCLDRVRADWKDELSARQCPDGVNDAQLDECLARIRGEDCGNPLDSLARLVECRSGQVCQT